MAIQKENLIKAHAASLQTQVTTLDPNTSGAFPSARMQKNLESTHIACHQKAPVAVPVVLLFIVSTDVISYILSAGLLQDFLVVFLPEGETEGLWWPIWSPIKFRALHANRRVTKSPHNTAYCIWHTSLFTELIKSKLLHIKTGLVLKVKAIMRIELQNQKKTQYSDRFSFI